MNKFKSFFLGAGYGAAIGAVVSAAAIGACTLGDYIAGKLGE